MDVTVVVRLSRDAAGTLRGVVERVKTGRKERFVGSESLGPLIARTIAADPEPRPRKSRRS